MSARVRTALLAVAGMCAMVAGFGAAPAPEAGAISIQYLPSVVPKIACVVRDGATDAVWFGFTNVAPGHLVVGTGADNSLVAAGVVSTRQVQVVDFLPGTTPSAFVARVPADAAVTWKVTAPAWDRINARLSSTVLREASAVRTAATPICPVGTPAVGVSAQIAPGGLGVSTVPSDERRVGGSLVASSVRLRLAGVRTQCVGPGATVLTPSILWGYAPAPGQHGAAILPAAGADYAPLSTAQVVRTDVFGAGPDALSFQRSYTARRAVVDPQRIWVFGATPLEQLRNPSPRGYSGMGVIADVTTRCDIAGTVRTSRTALWVDASGGQIPIHTVTDVPTQSTRAFVVCPFGATPPVTGCDVPPVGIGPFGIRFR